MNAGHPNLVSIGTFQIVVTRGQGTVWDISLGALIPPGVMADVV